jgi:hypothetical protein
VDDLLKIACSLINAYFPPLSTNNPDDEEFARIMLQRKDMPNLMQAQVRDERLGVPSMWNRIEDSYVPDFPVLSDRELRAGKEDKRLNFWWDGNATSLSKLRSCCCCCCCCCFFDVQKL